jgi:Zn-dependent peptidase ImmA (M78 family)/DNA-binding XRE family transcriptional regulator
VTAIPVNPRVLVWARSERGLDTITAAERLGITPEELVALEDGEVQPTVTLLRKMAAKYEIGFSALLMPDPLPPSTRLKVSDFRTHMGAGPNWTPELLATLDEINVLIDALADLRDANPHVFRPVQLPRATGGTDPIEVARQERVRLAIPVEAQLGLNSDAEAFRRFRSLVEESGVFVYVITAGDAEDWRGIAIYDEREIPVIVINGGERENGWKLFTLFHEYYHLLLRQTAISDQRSENPTEALCNRFAAHFLMPAAAFIAEARDVNGGHRPWDLKDVKKLADRFHLSVTATAIHLEDVGLTEKGFGFAVMSQIRRGTSRQRSVVVSYYEQMVNRWGGRHFDVVFGALDADVLDQVEAYEITAVKPENFAKMRSAVAERKAAYGWRG